MKPRASGFCFGAFGVWGLRTSDGFCDSMTALEFSFPPSINLVRVSMTMSLGFTGLPSVSVGRMIPGGTPGLAPAVHKGGGGRKRNDGHWKKEITGTR